MSARISWDNYFLEIAKVVATRATCPRKRVGAIIVSASKHILATGYNGSTPGAQHCDEAGCLIEDNHCVRVVHAEGNAIAQAAGHGISVHGAMVYTTANPCWMCFKLLVNAGIKRMCFGEFYREHEHGRVMQAAHDANVELVDLSNERTIVAQS